jgi:hypothetical protein
MAVIGVDPITALQICSLSIKLVKIKLDSPGVHAVAKTLPFLCCFIVFVSKFVAFFFYYCLYHFHISSSLDEHEKNN